MKNSIELQKSLLAGLADLTFVCDEVKTAVGGSVSAASYVSDINGVIAAIDGAKTLIQQTDVFTNDLVDAGKLEVLLGKL